MVNKTIFGEPIGKWTLGTTDTHGTEAALSGKFIGDTIAVDYPTVAVRVPEKTEEYLTYRYGKDWHIPRKDWLTARDDGAVLNFSAT